MSEVNPVNQRFQLLAENDQIQNYLQRHGLVMKFCWMQDSFYLILEDLWKRTSSSERARTTFETNR